LWRAFGGWRIRCGLEVREEARRRGSSPLGVYHIRSYGSDFSIFW
jgi:hypothetical protein